jgi:acyl-CoA synthetase (NDP forming)
VTTPSLTDGGRVASGGARTRLQRLLAPERLAVVGGATAEEVVRQCRAIGYAGEIWPVNPGRTTVGGLPCFPDLDALPGVPDAAFVSVSSRAWVRRGRPCRRRWSRRPVTCR